MRTLQLAPPAVTAELERYVDTFYPAYRDGHLLVAGGIADQPARYLAFMQVIAAYERRVQAKKDAIDAQHTGEG